MVQNTRLTELLVAAGDGEPGAMEELASIVYDGLRGIAHRQMRGERQDHTLGTTGLVHEAFLKLVDLDRIEWRNRAQFFAVAARTMRRLLVNYALQRRAQKRGGDRLVPLGRLEPIVLARGEELLALDEALQRLHEVNSRWVRVVECRFFAGMTVDETAEALDSSAATVKRDWTMARAWLNRELGGPTMKWSKK